MHDIRDTILKKAKVRMRRANIRNYEILETWNDQLPKLLGKCDWVVCDVPNSATGTFRYYRGFSFILRGEVCLLLSTPLKMYVCCC